MSRIYSSEAKIKIEMFWMARVDNKNNRGNGHEHVDSGHCSRYR